MTGSKIKIINDIVKYDIRNKLNDIIESMECTQCKGYIEEIEKIKIILNEIQ